MARAMKDSGVEWVGEMPEHWKTIKAKYVVSICHGTDPQTEGNTPVYGSGANSFKTCGEYKEGPAVLVGRKGATLHIPHYIAGNYWNVDTAFDVKTRSSDILLKYYYYLAVCFDYQFYISQTTLPGMTQSSYQNMVLPFPPIEEQRTMLTHLESDCSAIDALMEKTRASIEEYKKLKQSIITQAVTKGIRGDRSMKDSGLDWLGKVPGPWKLIKVKWLLTERNERSTNGTEEPLSMSQKYGLIPTKNMDMVPNMASSFEGAKLVHTGDLVFNRLKAHLGVFSVSRYDGLVSPDYAVFFSAGKAEVKYLEYLFKTPIYIGEFRKKSTGVGAGLTRLYTDDLYSIYTALPPLEEQQEIMSYLDAKCAEIDALIAKKEQFITELETYKKSLIYEYVTGKKEVPEDSAQMIVLAPQFPAVIHTSKPRFAQAVLMSRILDICRKNIGRVKLEKIMYTVEYAVGFDFDTQYTREAAGPLDASIYECEGIVSKRNKWFTISQSKYGVSYKPNRDMEKYKRYYDQYFPNYDAEIMRIIGIFKDYSTDQAEMIATLYGVWNDFVIENRVFTDDDIVDEVLDNWNESKRRFGRDVWLRAIETMRKNNLIPKGYGRHTRVKEVAQ